MGWLFYTLLLVCYISVRADGALTSEELDELSRKLEKVESGLSTADRVERIERLLNLQRENVHDVRVNKKSSKRETANPKNCQDMYNAGSTTSGVYSIYPDGVEEVQAFCEQELAGGGWTVFQRRFDGSVDFYRKWDEYQRGFGNATGEYWLGNDHLHSLTAHNDTRLMIELTYGGETKYAKYGEFWIQDGKANYRNHVARYTGGKPPGDSLTWHDDRAFSTYDKDNDPAGVQNCALDWKGAWWYNWCHYSNLNGLYGEDSSQGMIWHSWKGFEIGMTGTRMMVKQQ